MDSRDRLRLRRRRARRAGQPGRRGRRRPAPRARAQLRQSGYVGSQLVALAALAILMAVLLVRPERPVRPGPERGGSDAHASPPRSGGRTLAAGTLLLAAVGAGRSWCWCSSRSTTSADRRSSAADGLPRHRGRRADGAHRPQRADLAGPRRADGGRRLHDGAAAPATTRGCRWSSRWSSPPVSPPWSASLIGVAAARLHGPYLAGATLALAVGAARHRPATSRRPSAASRASGVRRPRDARMGPRRGYFVTGHDLTRSK